MENIATRYDEQTKRAQGSRETEQCDQGNDKRYSDLCAQWKAADAAADSAWWAAVGGFASAISTLLVLIALYFAFRSNWIARDTAKRQLRAYVNIRTVIIEPSDDVYPNGRVSIEMVNSGVTPARNVKILAATLPVKIPPGGKNKETLEAPLAVDFEQSSIDIPAQGSKFVRTRIGDVKFTPSEVISLESGIAAIYAWGHIRYADVFGDPQETFFRMIHDPYCRDGALYADTVGNSAT